MLEFATVTKSYPGPYGRVSVLRDLSFKVKAGELAVIQGPSGCGKTTLLFSAGAMLPPENGAVILNGQSLYAMPPGRRNRLRGTSVGFVFQRFHLIPWLNVAQNILWPLRWSADRHGPVRRLPELAHRLEIDHRLTHRPSQLSAGEQQRVALARALLGEKTLICADEPTGNLDERNAVIVIDMLKEAAVRGAAVLLVTHHPHLAGLGDVHIRRDTADDQWTVLTSSAAE